MKEKVSHIRKQQIIEKALALFLEDGYHAISIARLAKESQMAKGLLYYYFDSKETLLLDVIDYVCTIHAQKLEMALRGGDFSFYEKFMIVLDAYHQIHPDSLGSVNTAWLSQNSFVELFHRRFLEKIDGVMESLAQEGVTLDILQKALAKRLLITILEGITGLTRIEAVDRFDVIHLLENRFDLKEDALAQSGNRILVHF